MRRIPWHLHLLCLLSAGLQILPFPLAGPVPAWRRLFCWICLVPLLAALSAKRSGGKPLAPWQTAWLGYVCGIAWYLGNCYWIYSTMYLYGNMSEPAAAGVLILFALYLGLYMALFGLLFGLLRRTWGTLIALSASPILWVAVELARARITSFPWDLLGYTQVDNLPLTQLAPWTGVFGLSLIIASINALWALTLEPAAKKFSRWLLPLACCLVALFTILQFSKSGPPPANATAKAVLLQENLAVGGGEGARAENKDAMLLAFAQLSQHPTFGSNLPPTTAPQIIAWPESPAAFEDSDLTYRQFMEKLAQQTSAPILADNLSFGARNPDGTYSLYNSASFFKEDGTYGGRYDKIHLVPFGEYVPYKPLFFFAGHLLDGLPFIPGTKRVLFNDHGRSYGVFICYESIFGDEIRQFVVNGAQVLVNLSDDGWYGDTSAPWEHLDMVRMRAMENRRWILRSTNTGVTASIDPYGRVVDQMPRHIRGSLLARFDFNTTTTFYTRHGDWLAWLCAIVTIALLVIGLLRRRAADHSKLESC